MSRPTALEPVALSTAPVRQPHGRFINGLLLALAGYLLFDRAAAYIHIPGTTAYLGEVVLAIGLLSFAGNARLLWAAVRSDPVLTALAGFFLWGVLRALPNLGAYGVKWALRDSALWYYTLFAVLVAAATLDSAELPRRFARNLLRFAPLLAVWLPIAVLLSPAGGNPGSAADSRVHVTVPFTSVSIVSHKDGNVAVAALLGLVALWLLPDRSRSITRRRLWSFLLVSTVLFAATQNRGGFVAVAVAAIVGMLLVRGLYRRIATGVLTVGLALLSVTLLFPHLGTHSARSVSFSQLASNIGSIANTNDQSSLQGTVTDRKLQWSFVINLQASQDKMVYGWGPGPNLGFGQATGIGDATLRAPHNSHLDVLARLGFVGLGLWILLWVSWFWRMVTGHMRLARLGLHERRGMADVCLLTAIAILVNAFFDPSLESAQAAVLLWTVFGFGAVLTNPRWIARGLFQDAERTHEHARASA